MYLYPSIILLELIGLQNTDNRNPCSYILTKTRAGSLSLVKSNSYNLGLKSRPISVYQLTENLQTLVNSNSGRQAKFMLMVLIAVKNMLIQILRKEKKTININLKTLDLPLTVRF